MTTADNYNYKHIDDHLCTFHLGLHHSPPVAPSGGPGRSSSPALAGPRARRSRVKCWELERPRKEPKKWALQRIHGSSLIRRAASMTSIHRLWRLTSWHRCSLAALLPLLRRRGHQRRIAVAPQRSELLRWLERG